jgi:hypothetical protein
MIFIEVLNYLYIFNNIYYILYLYYIDMFLNDKSFIEFWNGYFIITYHIYKIIYNLIIKSFYIFFKLYVISFLQFLHNYFSKNTFIIITKIWNLVQFWFRYYNRRYIKVRKRKKLYYRFHALRPVKILFYIYLIILLMMIWKRRNLYLKSYYVYYYFLFFFSALFITHFLYFFLFTKWISAFIAIHISFIALILWLK